MAPCSIQERFWNKVQRTDTCWLWTASTQNRGYGQFCIRHGIIVLAHRFSYELHRGAIPVNLCVLHRCDCKRCVNPEHLFLGTEADNTRDMILKGRQTHLAKLTTVEVFAIRNDPRKGCLIAALYNISSSTVSRIKLYKSWAHL